ncbi:MAG TPA: hypothetical protein VF972_01945, partial [Actinomycetota bacterium]
MSRRGSRGVGAALALIAGLGWLATPARAQTRIDPRTYLTRLDRAEALARRGTVAPSPPLMDAIQTTLGLPLDVLVNGRLVPVPLDPVLSALPGDIITDFQKAEARISALALEVRLVLKGSAPPRSGLSSALADAYR